VKKYILIFLVVKLFTSSAVGQNLQLIDSINGQLTRAQGENKFTGRIVKVVIDTK